ncbi:MAG: polysaccharide deacetylase family protein [Planctomycetes bacterium]|nr:polysaccharide deacetylase family protein [Planctomycetota bacterium]
MTAHLLTALVIAFAAGACSPEPPSKPRAAPPAGADPAPIPAKTVVLTFDDAFRSHLDFVAPILGHHGFGATFFITARWMDDREHYLDFEGVAALHRLGFEIGNHTHDHTYHFSAEDAPALPGQIRRLDEALAAVGVPRPVTFGWTANSFGPEALGLLRDEGYRFARRGRGPEYPLSGLSRGARYDPRLHHRLLIPASVVNSEWTVPHFRSLAREAVAGTAMVFQFHGVPDHAGPHLSVRPDTFRAFMAVLAEEGFNVLAIRDLSRYGVERIPSQDPMTKVRYSSFD